MGDVTLYDDELWVHYGFGSVTESDAESPDLDDARAGHTNGLCCAGIPGSLSLMFGLHTNTGIVDVTEPIIFSTVVFRDPDNIQLELIAM